MTQTILTFISRVKPESVEDLRRILEQIGDDPEKNSYVSFRSLKLLHFGCFFLHESQDYGPYLVFENNFDGPLDSYLEDLYSQAGPGLHQIYSRCQDYGVKDARDRQGLLSYLKAHVAYPNAYHIGNVGRSAARILQENQLRDALEDYADNIPTNPQPSSPAELFATFQKFVRSDPRFAWVGEVAPRQTFAQRVIPWVRLILVVLIAILMILLLLPAAIVVVLVLRDKESTDSQQASAADSSNVKKLVQREDRTHSVQNHMASITIVKPGWLRRLTLRGVLWFINVYARATQTKGKLAGIPSIHFAHWSMIDNGRRLLFVSNFDGSWENYLDDFIDKAASGLTAVWSNTVNFPRTRFLVSGGARDGPRFKAVARDSQTVTNAWYSAYWDLTVQGIDNNSSLREDILKPLDGQAGQAWLQRL